MLKDPLPYLGLFLTILGMASSATTICALFYNEQSAVVFFVAMTLSLILIGTFLRRIRSAEPF